MVLWLCNNQQIMFENQPFEPAHLLWNEARKCFRMYKTILEIMDYRQYVVPEESKNMTFQQFNDLFENKQLRDKREVFPPLEVVQMEYDDQFDPSIAVFYNFCNEEITAEYIKRVTQSDPKIRKFFLVAPLQGKGKSTAFSLDKKAQNYISELTKRDASEKHHYRVEIFRQDELYFNVLKHDLVPPHRLLTDPQKAELLQKYKVKESQLPKILLSDPVAKFLGLRRGQVVKISRKSETAGTYTTYRIAV